MIRKLFVLLFALACSSALAQGVSVIPAGGGACNITPAQLNTLVSDSAAHAASIASYPTKSETLYNKTLDGNTTVFNGSSTQDFSVATLTLGNIGDKFSCVYAYSGSNMSVSTGTTIIATYATLVTDSDSEFDAPNGEFTAKKSGVFEVDMGVYSAWSVTGAAYGAEIDAMIYKNGASYARSFSTFDQTQAGAVVVYKQARVTRIIALSAGDKITGRYSISLAGETSRPSVANTNDHYISIKQIR